ncbi:Hypothetical predicted protein [Pelobates cultripes]|uniref:Uncharacterized protein n=1 Tax=Pelobates cultripes TaxID=61616 RepID=A0AAD1RWK0_PELCU|nr:Hypothetical predicted protein [Pelobates cultripes]
MNDDQEFLRIQADCNKRLRQLNRARNIELHKLRCNMVQGNSSIAKHLESLTHEVWELYAHPYGVSCLYPSTVPQNSSTIPTNDLLFTVRLCDCVRGQQAGTKSSL